VTLRRVAWPVVIIVPTVAVTLLWLAGIAGPLRVLLAFWVLLVCPGMAIVGIFGVRDIITRLVAAVALSLAIDCLIAMAMVYRVGWSPEGGYAVIAAISVAGAGAQLWHGRSEPLVGAETL
jgi:hypothetical protein